MSQTVITSAFEQLKAQEAANGGVVILDEFVFANIPNLDITSPIDRGEGLPDAALIVHRQAVGKTGMVNNNAVVYSVVMGADVGDFDFNWVGLVNSANNVVAMIVHAPTQKKIKTATGQQGNVLTRSFLMEYNGASEQTQIITPADTWQIDFTARLNGVDERIRRENMDIYGEASFLGDGFLVSKTGSQYVVKKGVGYVAGVRAELLFDQNITVSQKPVKVWADVAWKGTLTSVWASAVKLTVAETLENYIDNDEQHYVYALADVLSDGSIHDLRTVNQIKALGEIEAKERHLLWLDEKKTLSQTEISEYMRDMLRYSASDEVISNLELNSSHGGELIGIGQSTVSELTEVNIFTKMTRADINTIRNTPGAEVNVGYALQALIDEGHKSILWPHDVKGVYTLAGDVTVPAPVTLISFSPCVKPYTIAGDSSFLNKGAVIRKAAGADYIFGPGTTPRIYGLLLDGRDSSRPLFNNQNQPRGGILFNCGVYRFLYGIGSYAYTSIQVGMSSICANQDAVYNLIDSRLINCTINANIRHGVYLRNGANNNLFQNIRNEWNGGVGYLADGSVGNIINGELVDRNGSANFAVLNGGGFLVGDLFSQRPGRTSAAGSSYNTHFYMEGAGSYIMLSNVVTRTGIDDDGQGILTPERVLTTGGGSADMTFIASGCDLSGYTLSALRQITTAEKIILRGNKGVPDLITTGLYQFQNGRGNIGGVKNNQTIQSGEGSTLSVSFNEMGLADPTSTQTTIPICRTLLIEWITVNGVPGRFKLPFQIRRVVKMANVDFYTSEAHSSPSGEFAITGAKGVNVSLTVNEDATLTTVRLTSVDGLGRILRITILDH
ncbi:phage tail protein [Klebsiella pneumoniae]